MSKWNSFAKKKRRVNGAKIKVPNIVSCEELYGHPYDVRKGKWKAWLIIIIIHDTSRHYNLVIPCGADTSNMALRHLSRGVPAQVWPQSLAFYSWADKPHTALTIVERLFFFNKIRQESPD